MSTEPGSDDDRVGSALHEVDLVPLRVVELGADLGDRVLGHVDGGVVLDAGQQPEQHEPGAAAELEHAPRAEGGDPPDGVVDPLADLGGSIGSPL